MVEQRKPDLAPIAASGEQQRRQTAESGRASGLTSPNDKLNQQIVRLLQEDGRRPFNEIAVALSVSEGTIRNRVNGMRQAGQIRIVALVDPGAVNYKTDAMVCIKVSSTATPAQVARRLGQLEEVVYVLWVSGRFDLLVEMVSDEQDGLARFLEDHVFNRDDIAEVESMNGLKNFKNQFLLKQNLE